VSKAAIELLSGRTALFADRNPPDPDISLPSYPTTADYPHRHGFGVEANGAAPCGRTLLLSVTYQRENPSLLRPGGIAVERATHTPLYEVL
jgi:hypothetical protein